MKNVFYFLIFMLLFSACKKDSNDILPIINKNELSTTLQKSSDSSYFVANYVDVNNIGLHHTHCVRYILDNLKEESNNNPQVINNYLINGEVKQLMQEYCSINGLTMPSTFPDINDTLDYEEVLDDGNFSDEMVVLLTNSFEVYDSYSSTDSMFASLNENLIEADNLTNIDERKLSKITINVLKSSLNVWIVQNYINFLPKHQNLNQIEIRLSDDDAKVLGADAVGTLVGAVFGGFTPLSICTAMIEGTGASIGEYMDQQGYDTWWWPF